MDELQPSVNLCAHDSETTAQVAFEEARQVLRDKNVAQLGHVRFHLYHNQLPHLAIGELPASPVFGSRPPVDQFPDYDTSIPWKVWSEEAVQRVSNLYRNDRVAGVGEHITIFMGSPGSGKTTVLKRLLFHLQNQGMTCVFVPLSVYNTSGPQSLFEAAKIYYIDKLALNLPVPFDRFLEREIAKQRLVLLVDSLDEADVPHRQLIVAHALALGGGQDEAGTLRLRVPTFLSSRYVPPLLDREPAMRNALVLHLAGITPDQAFEHIELLCQRLEQREEDSSLISRVGNYARRMRSLGQHLRSVKATWDASDKNGPVPRTTASPSRRAERTLYALTYPLFLHLHIELCLERGVAEWSFESIIARYVEFLLGKWMDSRSENPEQDQRDEGRANLQRALAYLAFELTLREHVGMLSPTPAEVEELLINYFRTMSYAPRTDAQLSEFVRDQLARARTAEIFEADTQSYSRFGTPADVLRGYYVGQFIEQGTKMVESAVYPGRRRPTAEFAPLKSAAYAGFLANPNLRFLEQPMVFYFKSLFENGSVAPAEVFSRFERALVTPPVKTSLTGCTEEELEQIVPLNLIFLGRALEGDVANQFTTLYDELHEKVGSIFNTTNFATVYDELLPIVRPLQDSAGFDVNLSVLQASNRDDMDLMDVLWRRLPTAGRLMQLAHCVKPIEKLIWDKLTHREQVLLRRIVYQLRYHAATFDDTVLRWLWEVHTRAPGFAVADTVLRTARLIRNTLPLHVSFDWSYFESAEESYRANVETCRREIARTWETVKRDAGEFVNALASDDQITFNALQRASTDLHALVRANDFALQDAVRSVIRRLDDPRRVEPRGKALLILGHIAGTFRGQQLLLPREYWLPWLEWGRPTALPYSAEDLLERLFAMAKPHLAPPSSEEEVAGRERSALGGLQLYDFAVEAIWAILWNSPYAHDSREEL